MTQLTHTDVLSSLSPDDKAHLTRSDTPRALLHLMSHLGAICIIGTCIALKVPFWGLLLLPHGILLVFLFTLSHECTHATPFGPKWLNDLVGHAIAPVLLLPFIWFRYFHFAHHRFTNDPEKDPELAGGGRPSTRWEYLSYLTGWGYWCGNVQTLMRIAFWAIDAPYLPPRKHKQMRREARVLLGIYLAAALSLFYSAMVIWLWLVPVLIAQPVLRLYLLAEHGLCPPVANMFENTRTTLTSRLVRWLAWNMPYHAEHHAFPAVPYHHLPDFHDHVAAHLKSVSHGYSEFTQAYLNQLER